MGGMDGSAERSTELTPKAHRGQTMCGSTELTPKAELVSVSFVRVLVAFIKA
mgnify:CR=1 FL=1